MFFSELKKTPHSSVGSILARAKTLANDENSTSYYLFGDPALRISTGSIDVKVKPYPDSVPSAVTISLPGVLSQINYSVAFTVRDSMFPAPVSNPPYAEILPSLAYSCDSAIAAVSGVFTDSITIPFPQSSQWPLKAIVYVWNDTADGRAELTIGAGAPNAVSQMPARKAAPGKPVLSKIRGSLVVANLQPGIHQIRIFDIRGRIVYCSEAAASAGSMTISLAGKNLGSGRYILQVRSKAAETNLPFVHVAGE